MPVSPSRTRLVLLSADLMLVVRSEVTESPVGIGGSNSSRSRLGVLKLSILRIVCN